MFWNNHSGWALFWLFIQQAIVALSTYLISGLGSAVVNKSDILLYLVLFTASLFVVYIPGGLSGYQFEKAKNKGIKRYVEKFSEGHRNSPQNLNDRKVAQELEAWLTTEGEQTIAETYTAAYDSSSLALNMIGNVVALCFAISPKIAIGYTVSVILMPGVAWCFNSPIARRSTDMQTNRKLMSQNLLLGWDNILAGNQYNFRIWNQEFTRLWETYNRSSLDAVFYVQCASSIGMVLALIPVAANIAWIFVVDLNEAAKLAGFIATLPRQIQIIQNMQALSSHTLQWSGVYEKYRNLIQSTETTPYNQPNLLARITPDSLLIYINNRPTKFKDLEQILKILKDSSEGRMTIKGSNGSGKSTLIELLKKELADKAYYLPAQSDLMFKDDINKSLSTGQRMFKHIKEITKQLKTEKTYQGQEIPERPQILLLDEWAANLDVANTQKISNLLDELSQRRWVVEVYHDRAEADRKGKMERDNEDQQPIPRSRSFTSLTMLPDPAQIHVLNIDTPRVSTSFGRRNSSPRLTPQFDSAVRTGRSVSSPSLQPFEQDPETESLSLQQRLLTRSPRSESKSSASSRNG